jgi:hypothetical protein
MGIDTSRNTKAPKILVGTFHKTGTNLMLAILQSAARAYGLTIWRADAKTTEPAEWDIYFDWHSKFPDAVLSQPHKGVVVFRDPRDVIVSGAYFHCKSTEAWLLKPQEKFEGLSYQQKIQSLSSDDARFLFEMK